MGTKVHCKSYLPGFYSMRDLNEDSSSSSWPLFYGDKTIPNGPYYNGFMPRTSVDGYPGHDKDALKQKILEHEAVFKTQVCELHRLYRIQRDMMEEVKRKELHKNRTSMEPASSSSFQGSQMPSEDARKWHMAGFPLLNSSYGRTSVSGVEIVNSPMSCTKGNSNKQPSQFPFQNGSDSKDFETLDSRPSKVRKKLFDLQLPADEYIDTEEGNKSHDYKVSEILSYAPKGHPNNGPESSMKLFLGGRDVTKTDCLIDASASASCLRGSIGLADLNEPIQIEEETGPSSIDFLGHTSENVEKKGINQPVKSNTGYLGVTGETMHARDRFLINSSIESKLNDRGPFSHLYEPGSIRSNFNSVTQGRQPEKSPLSSHTVQGMLNQVHHASGMYPSSYSREDFRREGIRNGLEYHDRSHDLSNNSHLEPLASQNAGPYSFFSSSSFASSWAHSVPSWAKPTSSFAPKITTLETSLNSAGVMSKPSAQSQEPFGGKWHVKTSSMLNPGSGNESTLNGFYHGSASGSKELQVQLPLAGRDYLNSSRSDNVASDRSNNHGLGNFPKDLFCADTKPARDINLNEVISKGQSDEVVILQDLNATDEKCMPSDRLSALPWLEPKPARVNEVADSRRSELSGEPSYLQASANQLSCKNETVRDLNQLFTPKVTLDSADSEIARKKEIAETHSVKKILGFPIFERGVLENELLSVASTSASVDCCPEGKNVNGEKKNRIIDINVACEPDEPIEDRELTVEKENQKNGTSMREPIDLNSCVGDCEDPPASSYERKSASIKITLEIDLEVPVFLENEDDNTLSKPEEVSLQLLQAKTEQIQDEVLRTFETKNEQTRDEVLRNAAEIMFAISTSCPQSHTNDNICQPSEASLEESLLWFVDAVSSFENELENTSGKESRVTDSSPEQDSSEEIDEFEAMTLQLEETKEEDYMPKPFVPEVSKVEDTGSNALTTRSRRGQSRRGRQRRDFQRDILPGLASLSRHEVTEDIQTFGGLMRATGHAWNSGLARRNGTRNGGARGRRRAVVDTVPTPVPSPVCAPLMNQLNQIEAGLEDRSLTGWGKTTRRPRRQRCPAGNPPTVALT
ncbi:hypothetical protein CDL12_05343 [Handroanthus impetiginosus]|uniref:Uncharacterized protein n=1 Tax=Handroanthus impetiginosus TaxID=429701 RepID=A0A2G9HX75_9LAMI|nr:hypothetical protein CDL12_05343 [Handroanthus impetiginosus]